MYVSYDLDVICNGNTSLAELFLWNKILEYGIEFENMCNTSLHQRNFNNLVEPFSFSTFHFLRTRNRLMLPTNAGNVDLKKIRK